MSITDNCMIVGIHVGKWSGHRFDKRASSDLNSESSAESDVARVNKSLIPKESAKKLTAAYGAIYTHVYSNTLPWKDNGDRLLPRALYEKFIEQHHSLRHAFEDEVSDFLDRVYPALRARAQFRMGALFDPNDFPDVADLRRRYYVHLDIDAVTTSHDFRVKMEQDALDEVRSSIETAMNERVNSAMRGAVEQLSKALGHFQKKMADEKEIFRDSTVANLEEIVSKLPAFNILGDEKLDELIDEIRSDVLGNSAKDLRKNPEVRSEVATKAQEILAKMSGFMNAFGGE